MPESPYYLVKINDKEGAMSNLMRLSGKTTDRHHVERWMDEVQKTVEKDMENGASVKEFFFKKEYRKPIYIMAGRYDNQFFVFDTKLSTV